ncbi:hypothetical protein Btru_017136 [Bulinus truncatus]|nr:hypothetical protein Btru_017136 [Bulinus truncatus]
MLFSLVLLPKASRCLECLQQHLCYCLLPNSSYIDLSPLANETFDLFNTEGVYRYAISLCKPFSKYADCTDVFGCQYNNETGKFNDLGKTQPTFVDIHTLMLENDTTKVYIDLVCSKKEDDFHFASNFLTSSPFNFTLESKFACPMNTSESTTSTSIPHITNSTSSTVTSSPTTGHAAPTNTTSATKTSTAPSHASSTTVRTSRGTTALKTTLTTHHSTAKAISIMTTPLIAAVVFISKLLI